MSTIDPDTLHRTIKLELDEGRAATLEDAITIASGYTLQIDVGPEIDDSPTMQAMLLTAVNTGARAFLGGVHVRAATNPVLAARWSARESLTEAIRTYGGRSTTELSETCPTLVIGRPPAPVGQPLLYLTWNAWAGAAVATATDRLAEMTEFPLAGVLAGALGVSEVFQYVRGSSRTGWRSVGLSLWRPDIDWRDPMAAGPACPYMPQRLLIAGLGHLGQALCWTFGFLPYPMSGGPALTLWDFDTITEANCSTGLLTTPADLGVRKTRVIAARLEQIGFTTAIIERCIDANTRRTVDEPNWALAGFDQPEPRRALANAGFDKVVDLGLGAGSRDYLDILLHVFPSDLHPERAWPTSTPHNTMHALPAAYRNLIQDQISSGVSEGAARCGVIGLAGRSVAAAFVGATAATIAVAETLRELLGGATAAIPSYEVVSVSLADPNHLEAAPNQHTKPIDNPGFMSIPD